MCVMAFLRSICAQRTSLVYNYSGSSSGSLAAAGLKVSIKSSSDTRELSQDASQLNYIQKQNQYHDYSSYYQRHHQQKLEKHRLFVANALFSPILNQHQCHQVHTNANNSQTVTNAHSILNEEKISSVTKKPQRRVPPTPNVPENPQRDPLDVSFNDPIAAFKSKTTWELIRAYVVYIICSSEKLVEHNMKVRQVNKILRIFFF